MERRSMQRKENGHRRIKQACYCKKQMNAGEKFKPVFGSYAAAPKYTGVFQNQCSNSNDPQYEPCTFTSYERSDTVIISSDEDTSSSFSHGVVSMGEEDSSDMEPFTPRRACKARLVLCYDSDPSDELTSSVPLSCKTMKEAAETSKGREHSKRKNFVDDLLHRQCLSEYAHHACWHEHKKQFPRMVPSDSDNDKDEIYKKICKPEVTGFTNLQELNTTAGTKAKTSKVRGFGKSIKKIQKEKENKNYACTVCNEALSKAEVLQHPILAVSICQRCKDFIATCRFNTDEDGFEGECTWCGDGGDLVCCGHCRKVFCRRCIKDKLGKKELHQVLHSDGVWLCYVCNPKPLKHFTQQLKRARKEIPKSPLQVGQLMGYVHF
ncbi:hypothetical protein O6H91_18G036300 [Diphasiastrum complanatum]|uniref:Uncharacterized protein n=1 Tax=Diphasiastrum complanatum TaxID=34168 RepID=A0ACC2AZY4_DIPCM|nr:hypothetical protein O6H91_18G036300 [Diphasiastrum complanatum]